MAFAAALVCALGAATGSCSRSGPEHGTGARIVPATAEQIQAVVRAPGAKAVLLNVWGTWCGPCREEFPDLVRLGRRYESRGLRLVLLSVDFDSELPQVREFLAGQGVAFTTYIRSGGDDNAFINALSPRWSGALPATFVYDGTGRLRDFWEGKASYARMEERLLSVLGGHDNRNPEEVYP